MFTCVNKEEIDYRSRYGLGVGEEVNRKMVIFWNAVFYEDFKLKFPSIFQKKWPIFIKKKDHL